MQRIASLLIVLGGVLPGPGEAQQAVVPDFATIAGNYAPGGDCALWPRVTIEATRIQVYGWEGGDILFLDRWRDCADCLADAPASPQEVRLSPVLGDRAGDAPVLRVNADGVAGALVTEPGGDLTDWPELAALIDHGALARCDLAQVSAAPLRHPEAEGQWRRRDDSARLAAGYCPVQDPGGDRLCLEIGCDTGGDIGWRLETGGAIGGTAASIPAEILVGDEVVGRMTFGRPDGDAAGPLRAAFDSTHGVTLVALQRGAEAELRIAADSGAAAYVMGLRGSNRALDGIVAACGERLMAASPANRPDRFLGGMTGDGAAAAGLAQQVMAGHLDQMRQAASDANPGLGMGAPIDVQAAWLTEFEDGWSFLVATVGPSNFHFGMSGFGTLVWARPPGQDWRRIGPDTSEEALVWFDSGQRNQGWPRLVFQGTRGVQADFHVWRWDGQAYVHDRRISP